MMTAQQTTATTRYQNLTLGKEVGFINPRTTTGLDAKSLGELANDIEENGLTDPPMVWAMEHDGQAFEVILRGQRRFLATGILIERGSPRGKELAAAMPIMYVACESVLDAEVYAGREIAHSPGISTFELAAYMAHLRDRELNGKEIAKRLNKSESWVSRILAAFSTAGPELRTAWAKGAIPDDAAKDIAKIKEPEQQVAAVKELLETRATGNRKEIGKAKKKILEKVEPKKKPANGGANNRRVASDFDEMLDTLRALDSKHPLLLGMLALTEWGVGLRTDAKLPPEFHAAVKAHEIEEAKRPKFGEKVTWKSQANGKWATKTGVIVEVVEADNKPKKYESTSKRTHESYVVDVEGEMYWPVVSQIKRLGAK